MKQALLGVFRRMCQYDSFRILLLILMVMAIAKCTSYLGKNWTELPGFELSDLHFIPGHGQKHAAPL